MEYIVRLPSALKQILLQSGAVRWAQLALLRIFFDQNQDRSFESGKSLSKSHGNSLRANRGWFITQCFQRLAICPGFCPSYESTSFCPDLARCLLCPTAS